jgi:hypothetical protein
MTLPDPIDHIYIICNKEKEPDRALYLQTWLDTAKLDPTKYTFISSFYGDSIPNDYIWKVYDPWSKSRPMSIRGSRISYNMKLGEISLCINWGAAAFEANQSNHNVVMFWESDVLPDTKFLSNLDSAMQNLRTTHGDNWDFLSISAGANMRPQRDPANTMQKWFPVTNYFHTRTTDAMIFKVDMLKKIYSTYFPFAEVLDWELNYHLHTHKSRSFWLDPPIIKQGSAIGVYKTML